MAAPIGCRIWFLSRAGNRLRIPNRFSKVDFKKFSTTCRCKYPTDLRKFYKTATISQSEGWFEVNLDSRKLRTPLGNLFRVPNEALALAVATEWNAQDKVIKRHNMHLTSLCNTALDNPVQKTRDDLVRSILHFLETDTICYRLNEPKELVQLQEEKWETLIQWFRKRYEVHVESTTSLASPDIPMSTINKLETHLLTYGDWALFGFNYGTEVVKSLIIMIGLVDKYLSVEEAVDLSRLEQDFQIQQWGNVEWYHDIDRYELRARVAAAALFVNWCSESVSIKRKTTLWQVT